MTCGKSGRTGWLPLYMVGIQYPDLSPGALHSVPPASSDAAVLAALVVVFPMKVWSCDAPGWPGYTIGSSGRWWLTAQLAWNSWKYRCGGLALDGTTPVTGGSASTYPGPPGAPTDGAEPCRMDPC